MIEAFQSGGFIMWPMLATAIGIAWIALRTVVRVRHEEPLEDVRRGLQAMLFWGVMCMVLGLLGTVVGVLMTAQAIQAAGGAPAGLAWGGVAVALVSLVFGLLVFIATAVVWFALRQWSRRAALRRQAQPG